MKDWLPNWQRTPWALPPDAASAKLLANKILDVSTKKPTQVGTTPKMAAIVAGKVYRFARNALNLKSLSLILTDPHHTSTWRYTPEIQPNLIQDLPDPTGWTIIERES
jgi:hypothetical protein